MNGSANCSPIHSIPIELPLLTNTHQTFTFFDTVFFAAFFTVLLLFFPFAPPTAFAFLFVRIRMNTTTTIAAIPARLLPHTILCSKHTCTLLRSHIASLTRTLVRRHLTHIRSSKHALRSTLSHTHLDGDSRGGSAAWVGTVNGVSRQFRFLRRCSADPSR